MQKIAPSTVSEAAKLFTIQFSNIFSLLVKAIARSTAPANAAATA
jgi:hypothetical protein